MSFEVCLQEVALPAVFMWANKIFLLNMRLLMAFEENFLVKCFSALFAGELWLFVVNLVVFQLTVTKKLLCAEFTSVIASSDLGMT